MASNAPEWAKRVDKSGESWRNQGLITHGKIHMHNGAKKRMRRLFAGGVLIAFAGMAQAQYLWIDEKGMKQVSDRPPPSSIPAKNILKSPGGARISAPAAAAGTAATPEKAPLSVADREADYKKRSKEKAETDQKAADAAKVAADKQRHCNNLRVNKSMLDAGVRMNDGAGGDGVMDDAGRAKAQNATNAAIRQECS